LPIDFDEEAVACVEIVRNLTRRGVPLDDIQAVGEIVRKTASKADFASAMADFASAFFSALNSALGLEQAPRSPRTMVPATPFDDSSIIEDKGDSPSPVWGNGGLSPNKERSVYD